MPPVRFHMALGLPLRAVRAVSFSQPGGANVSVIRLRD